MKGMMAFLGLLVVVVGVVAVVYIASNNQGSQTPNVNISAPKVEAPSIPAPKAPAQ